MLWCFADHARVLKVLKVNMASSTHTSFTSLSRVALTRRTSRKRGAVVLVGVVDHLLAAVDELELDAALLVGRLKQSGRDLDLCEGSVKHDGPLLQGEVGPLSKRLLAAQVVEVRLLKLLPLAPLNGQHVQLRLNAQLDEGSDG